MSLDKTTKVQPQMTAGTVAIFLTLSHHIQSDELVVNGFDMLKLQQNELNLLARFVPVKDVQAAIEDSRASQLYQVAEAPSTPTSPQK
jgi:hypothetical protein